MSRLNKRTFGIAASAMQAGVDAAVTIAARTPGLISQSFNPTAENAREAQRMVQEKLDALLMVKASFGGIRNANDWSMGLAGVAEAAMRPAKRKVRANAKRLTGLAKMG
jgi:hypothetical protein